MPCLRHSSWTFIPASTSCRIEMICVSVNRDFFIGTSWLKVCQKVHSLLVLYLGKLTQEDELKHHGLVSAG